MIAPLPLTAVDHCFTGSHAYPLQWIFQFDCPQNSEKLGGALETVAHQYWPVMSQLRVSAPATLQFEVSSQPPKLRLHKVNELPPIADLDATRELLPEVISEPGGSLFGASLYETPQKSFLAVCMSHAVADGYSFFMFMNAWACAARGLATAAPLLDRGRLRSDLADASINTDECFAETGFYFSSEARCFSRHPQWHIRHYTNEQLSLLMAEARAGTSSRFTHNDILAASLWRESGKGVDTSCTEVSVSCPVDYRSHHSRLTMEYFGNAVRGAGVQMDCLQFQHATLGMLAEQIRAAVRGVSEETAESSLRFLELLRRSKGLGAMERLHVANPQSGLLVTNLSRFPLQQLDFGSGVPSDFSFLTPVPRGAVILPAADGVRVQICLG